MEKIKIKYKNINNNSNNNKTNSAFSLISSKHHETTVDGNARSAPKINTSKARTKR